MLVLDRMVIEEVGSNPERLAAAIHDQLSHKGGEVPVAAIAAALDIVEIKEAPLKNLEGALVAFDDRNVGAILLNSESQAARRRFTTAHELGHFLNLWHRPEVLSRGFTCSKKDLVTSWQKPAVSASRHFAQEAEANRFAIELLAPQQLMRPYLRSIPDLAKVVALSKDLGLSHEAGARRYVQLHTQPSAVVFSAKGAVRYVERNPEFPFVSCQPGQYLPTLPFLVDAKGVSVHEEADPRDWLAHPGRGSLVLQTLNQGSGYAITLLAFDETDSGGDDDEF